MATTTSTIPEHWRSLWEQPGPGWDRLGLDGRVQEESPPWDYEELVRHELGFAGSALHLGTGDGEFLRSLEDDLPVEMHATEGWAPNLPVARANLSPLGVQLREYDCDSGDPLPYPDACVDLVLCRDQTYSAEQVARVLRPGGWFVTEQVERRNLDDLAEMLGVAQGAGTLTLRALRREAEAAGLTVERAERWRGSIRFDSVEALVGSLRLAPDRLPVGLNLDRHAELLLALHDEAMPLVFTLRRCLLIARRPEPEPTTDPFKHW